MRATWTDRRWNGLLMALLIFAAWACADDGEGCDTDGCLDCDGENTGEPQFPYPEEGAFIPGGAQIRMGEALFTFIEDVALDLVPELLGDDADLPIVIEDDTIYFCFERDSFPIEGVGSADICADRNCGARFNNLPGCMLTLPVDDLIVEPQSPESLAITIHIGEIDDIIRARIRVLFSINCNVRLRADSARLGITVAFRSDHPSGLTRLEPELDIDFTNLRATISGGLFNICGTGQGAIDDFIGDIPSLFGDQLGDFTENFPEFVEIGGTFDLGNLLGGLFGGLDDGEPDPEPDPNAIERLLYYYIALGGFAYAEDNPQGGLSLGMWTGFHAEPDICVPAVPAPLPAGGEIAPSPTLHQHLAPSGAPVGLGIGIHRDALNLALWAVHRSGALCLELGAEDIEFLSTGVLGMILPTLDRLGDGLDRPMRLVLRPNEVPYVDLGTGDELITLHLRDLDLDFHLFAQDRYIRVLTLNTDIELPIGLDVDADGNLVPLIGAVDNLLSRVEARNAGLLTESETQVLTELLPTVIGLLLPGLSDGLIPPVELPELLGFRITIGEDDITSIDDNTMLAIFAGLELASAQELIASPNLDSLYVQLDQPARTDVAAHLADVRRGAPFTLDRVLPTVTLSSLGGAAPIELSWRMDDGPWSTWSPTPYTLRDRRLGAPGHHSVQVRARYVGLPATATAEQLVIPVITDFLAPSVTVEQHGATLRISARDDLSPTRALERAIDINGQRHEDFGTFAGHVELSPWAGQIVEVAVHVRDEAGNVGTVRKSVSVPGLRDVPPFATDSEPSATTPRAGCAAAPSSSGPAALLVLAGLLLGLRRRQRRRMATLAVLAAGLVLGACGSDSSSVTPADCTANADCADGQICEDGTCVAPDECENDDDCDDGYSCTGGVCAADVDCSTDFDCRDDQICRDGTCRDLDLGNDCGSDGDCSGDQLCVAGTCVDPLPECVTNNMCPTGQHCVDERCEPLPGQPECFDDIECPAGQVCRNRACQDAAVAPECIVSADCPEGERCVDASCAPPECTTSTECPDCDGELESQCFDGDCFCGTPCADGCPDDTFCCHDTDRCTPMPWACDGVECPPGYRPVVRDAATASSRSCDVDSAGECECVALEPLEEGRVGRWLDADAGGGVFAISAWNETYRDMVVGIVGESDSITWQTLDGIPADGRVVGDPNGPRRGIAEPGPDAGRHTAIAVAEDGTVHVIWHVESGPHAGSLRHGARTPAGDWTVQTVDSEGGGGLYGDVVLEADGTPVLFYMAPRVANGDNWDAELRVARPAGEGFDIATVAAAAVPLPCGGRCATGEECNADTNACTATISERWCDGCAGGESCFRGSSPGAFACAPVAEITGFETLPQGTGLFAHAIRTGDSAFRVVFHDSTQGHLYTATVSTADGIEVSDPVLVDGEAGRDTGRFAAVTGTDQGEFVAWVDETRRELVVQSLADNTRTIVDDGIRITDEGILLARVGQAARFLDCDGTLALAYQNATTGTLEISLIEQAGGAGWGWSEPTTIGGGGESWDGAWGFYLGIVTQGGSPTIVSSVLFNEGNDLRIVRPDACVSAD